MAPIPAGLLAVGAALFAAVLFGMEGIVGKRGMEAGGNAILASLIVAVDSLIIFGGIGLFLTGMTSLRSGRAVGIAAFFLSGVLASGIGVLATWQGVDRLGASINTAAVNSRPLFASVLGYLLLGESLGLVPAGGIVTLVVGLVLISLSKGGDIRGWKKRALAFPLGGAVVFALGNVLRRFALSRTPIPLFEGIAINAVGGLAVLVTYVGLAGRTDVLQAPRRAYGWFVVTGVITAVALLAVFFALEREQVAVIDALVATAPFFTLLFTRLFLRDVERITRLLLVGATFVVAGAVLIVGF